MGYGANLTIVEGDLVPSKFSSPSRLAYTTVTEHRLCEYLSNIDRQQKNNTEHYSLVPGSRATYPGGPQHWDRALSPDYAFDFAVVLREIPAGAHGLTLLTGADPLDPAGPADAPVAVVAEGIRRKVREKEEEEEEAHPG